MSDWREAAACKGLDSDLFYPAKNFADNTKEAREICESCPVNKQCLEVSVRNSEPFGIWAGLTNRQRRTLKQQRKQPKAG